MNEQSPTLTQLLAAFERARDAERAVGDNRDPARVADLESELARAIGTYEGLIDTWQRLNPPRARAAEGR